MEALAFGTPVVSTDCPSGPREVLQDGRYGRLVPVKNPETMAAAIVETLKSPLDADTLKQASRPYQLDVSVDKYLATLGFTVA